MFPIPYIVWPVNFMEKNLTQNQIDLVTISPMISPPLPASLVAPFFEALDENEDGHIDFKELSCGMSAACRGPEMERQKCKIFKVSYL